jgi:hypothetical protein
MPSLSVVVGVTRHGDRESILHVDQPLHRVGRGRVHANLAVPVDRHEAKRRIDGVVDDGEIQPVPLGDGPPVVYACAAERIHTQGERGTTNGVHVEHIDQHGWGRRLACEWTHDHGLPPDGAPGSVSRSRRASSPMLSMLTSADGYDARTFGSRA